ncbi:OLC1v1006656C1 [Oldenlandia corymbosa var. corymbosa]|uniref:OLC1v1006656C1 n=1 Tax=Oldenlandia corymbosa var. corymbosa TaxID=529605 RepID=A0AAV1DHV1_OLDCO|nr:OLC1v1006656C1 [Oldenlandia corymbosa var. corymbosa]
MEASALRRLAVLSSHIRSNPVAESVPAQSVFASACASSEPQEIQEDDCVFCKIIRGQSPALKIYEDDVCLCILDVNPLSQGHCLVIPKQHFSSLEATPPAVVAAMCSKVPLISKAVKKATGCDSFNLLVNNGAAAGQVIFHTHIHIIPRKASDCLWASESLRRRKLKLDQEAARLAHSIRERLQSLDNFEDMKSQGTSVIGT